MSELTSYLTIAKIKEIIIKIFSFNKVLIYNKQIKEFLTIQVLCKIIHSLKKKYLYINSKAA